MVDALKIHTLLGGITIDEFLSNYWQKKPLLIRQAIPNFSGFLDPNDLAGLACEESVQSRLILYRNAQWQLEHGPFAESRFADLPESNWTLLVQSVDHHIDEAKQLLQLFNFIPYARLDDLMVSYAPTGGSVGPHLDSYDVFLLQGQGTREWRISEQTDHIMVENVPLKILKQFNATESWVLNPGDMLYLPPQYAHWGVSTSDDCMTYSIGFRAPSYENLSNDFLTFLQDKIANNSLAINGRYSDADLAASDHPAKISNDMVQKVNHHLQEIKWGNDDVANFLGQQLTEPKPDVVFEANNALDQTAFDAAISTQRLVLDLQSLCLFDETSLYMNGEQHLLSDKTKETLIHFADKQSLDVSAEGMTVNPETSALLYAWYCAGYCHLVEIED